MVQPVEETVAHLTARSPLLRRAELLERPCPVPRVAGIYGFFFTRPPSRIPVGRSIDREDCRLLYLGIAPSRPGTRSNLRTRLRSHLRGNASGSTLRLTLGCLLADEIGIRLQPTGATGRLTFGRDGETALSEWMEKNVRVTWVARDEPWAIERALIERLDLPLNLEFNEAHPFHHRLRERRREMRRRARAAL